MKTRPAHTITISTYISGFPRDVQAILQRVRRTIKQAVPAAKETISYGIPAFTLDGKGLVSFAGWKKHISLYPVPGGDAALDKEMAAYRAGAGTLRFPLDRRVPYGLITRVARALKKRSEARTAARREST